jgi:hypothetical protein
MRWLLACFAVGLFGLGSCAVSERSAAGTSPSPTATPTGSPLYPIPPVTSPPRAAPTPPFAAPSPVEFTPTPRPSAPDGEAVLYGHVFYDQLAGRPVEGAVVSVREFALGTLTDASGRFELRGARPGPGCTWTAIDVRLPGYGSITFFDQALFAESYEASWVLHSGDHGHWFGPPLADPRSYADPASFCARGTYVPWRQDY